MGFMDWLMKGVEEPAQKDVHKPTFDEKVIENLKNISSSEMQESTTLSGPMVGAPNNPQMQSGFTQSGAMSGQGAVSYAQPQSMQPMQGVGYDSMMYGQQQVGGAMQPMGNYGYGGVPQGGMMNGGMNVAMPAYGTQSVYMQNAPNQPFTQATITIFQISTEEDIKYALKHLGKKSPCVISFGKMNKKKMGNLYQFLCGGVFALGATMVRWRDSDYLLTPRGMEISRQDRSKK